LEKAASLPINEVFKELNTSENGLTSQEAKLRLKKYGYNKLSEKSKFHSFTVYPQP
jgi:magnesium-transporting ATPase (P-type)